MSEAHPPSTARSRDQERARSFAAVADAYERARPSYPEAAATWLTGGAAARGSLVLELGAGTGKLTEVLLRGGQELVVTEPLTAMVRHLRDRLPVSPVVATAERIPMSRRSVDTVVCGQSFHWFDHDVALAEIAQVLRPGGHLAVAWNRYDTAIPWVRRFQDLIAPDFGDVDDVVKPLMETPYFGFVDRVTFRFWQPHTAATLADLTRSVSYFSTLDERGQRDLLAEVDALYAEYGRGHDGMQVPYVTHCYRAVVRHEELPPEIPITPAEIPVESPGEVESGPPVAKRPPEDPGMQLIDFR
jgi:SAM-dependent methyltransferase